MDRLRNRAFPGIRLALVWSLATSLMLLGIPSSAVASSATQPAQIPCGEISGSNTLPVPAAGKVAEVTIWLDSSCRVHVSSPVILDASAFQPGPVDESVPLDTVSGRSGTSGSTPLTNYNGAAYAVERTYDVAGINLNELYSNLTWVGNGSTIVSYYGWDGAIYHREGGGYTGWSLNMNDSYLRVVAGGVGSTIVKTEAHQGFNYQGVFDPTGTLYYNSYTEDLAGFAYGNWLCSYSYYWRHSFAGWTLQQFCGAGTTTG